MKKLLLLVLLLSFSVASIKAQQRNKERIKLLKTSFLTAALDLTSSEAEKFWPIYNLHTKKIQNARFSLEMGMYREIKKLGGIDNISATQSKKYIENTIALEKEISEHKIKMIKKLIKILPAKKILKLQKAEKDFNRRILQEYSKRRGIRRGK